MVHVKFKFYTQNSKTNRPWSPRFVAGEEGLKLRSLCPGPVNSQYQERGDALVQEAEAKLRYTVAK